MREVQIFPRYFFISMTRTTNASDNKLFWQYAKIVTALMICIHGIALNYP